MQAVVPPRNHGRPIDFHDDGIVVSPTLDVEEGDSGR